MSKRALVTIVLLLGASTAASAEQNPRTAKVHLTFVELHSARVEKDLLQFKLQLRFVDALEVRRERDRLMLFRAPQSQGEAVGIGLAMFAATTILSAHAPRPLRVVFDGPVHLGPAIFDGGGMGAGIGARGL